MVRATQTIQAATLPASGALRDESVVPERFRGTSAAQPGRSVVPPEFRSTSEPQLPAPTGPAPALPPSTQPGLPD
jgi:hypothetical protein